MYGKIVSLLLLSLAAAGFAFMGSPSDSGGCTLTQIRPCYDKNKNGKITVEPKGADKAYKACDNNAAPNEQGTGTTTTSKCSQEKYDFCYEGKSHIYMRKFDGTCITPTPTPEPPPTGTTTPTTTPPIAKPFRVLLPNGGESLPFGSSYPIRWEGGDPTWPVNIAIISGDGRYVRAGLAWDLANDGYEDWTVDLPVGDYIMYAEGNRGHSLPDAGWDYSDAPFHVVAGAPLGKINSNYLTDVPIVVLSPSGGESWAPGSTHTILWTGGHGSSTIDVDLINYAANAVDKVLASGTNNDGEFTWTVPADQLSGQYTMYVACTNCAEQNGTYGYSFNPFTITAQ